MEKKRELYYVLGLGQTGLSVVRYLQRHHHRCEVFDDKISPVGLEAFKAEFPDVMIHLHENPDISIEQMKDVREVIISPGVPFEHPVAQIARRENISIVGDIELFARQNKAPVVAITGTNGKSTVTTLVGEMAKAAGFKTLLGGNIGAPVLDFLDKGENFDWVVLELSSFQLESTFTLHSKIACILNITEDHMDRYASFEDYVAAKHRVYENAENLIVCADDPLTWPRIHLEKQHCTQFGLICSFPPRGGRSGRGGSNIPNTFHIQTQDNQKYLAFNQENLLNINELKIKGTHNWSNALAALAIGTQMGLPLSIMCDVLRQFSGLDHRCQWVRELNQVAWYNDSKGTNVGATLSAIKGLAGSIHGKIILLLGGQSKGADFADLCEPLKEHVRAVILYGEDADRIEAMLKESADMIPVIRRTTFEEVIYQAHKEAKPDDVVLLSPACASWDMFENYGHRGRVFAELVEKL